MKLKLFLTLLTLSVVLSSCTDPESTVSLLMKQGYSDIRISGYDFFGCGKGDVFATGFTAQTANGSQVQGVVCSGFMKGSTIRFY